MVHYVVIQFSKEPLFGKGFHPNSFLIHYFFLLQLEQLEQYMRGNFSGSFFIYY
jgi:hypothetical protein